MIPKIQYGEALPFIIELDYPPKGLSEGDEQYIPKSTVVVSQSGLRQVSTDYIEAQLDVTFGALSEAKFDALKSFYLGWAARGNSFRYYPDKDEDDFRTYELSDMKFRPKRTGIAGYNKFTRAVDMTFTRVTDIEAAEFMEVEIANNSSDEIFSLDSALYTSAKIFFEIRRSTDAKELVSNGYLTALYSKVSNNWSITAKGTYEGDEHGVEFFIDPDGVVSYVSDLLAGANYSGSIKIKSLTF